MQYQGQQNLLLCCLQCTHLLYNWLMSKFFLNNLNSLSLHMYIIWYPCLHSAHQLYVWWCRNSTYFIYYSHTHGIKCVVKNINKRYTVWTSLYEHYCRWKNLKVLLHVGFITTVYTPGTVHVSFIEIYTHTFYVP